MSMNMREDLDFNALPKSDKDWFLQETWCDTCDKADLGMKEPELYVENNIKYISGKCIICNTKCISTITEQDIDG